MSTDFTDYVKIKERHAAQAAAAEREKHRTEKAKKTRNGFDASAGISLDDFYAYMPQHNYIYTPSCETWPGCSVNARIPPIEVT